MTDPTIAQFPEKLQCLFQPKRYKVLYGGRGAGRSWGVSRALLIRGAQESTRVLCVREFQNSIEESVHKVISDQINNLGMNYLYKVEKAHIYGPNGTVFSFEGIKNNTNRVKSYEGIDICWAEEAAKITRASWGVLIPTIRKEKCPNGHALPPAPLDANEDYSVPAECPICHSGIVQSEIWMTFNPELETDYTYERFVKNADPSNSFVIKMTWADNPWFPRVLHQEMLMDKERDPDYALNVWEGHCLQMLEGAIYAKELRRVQSEGRICTVPWEREWPVDTFWDLGRADATAIWFAQRVAMQYRILGYFSGTGEDITFYLRELQRRAYVYGRHWLPHDAKAKRLGSKRTIEETVRQSYPNGVYIVPKLSVIDGINAARIILPNCYFDEAGCADGLQALRHYRYRVVDGRLSNEPLHDWASDGADAFRYLAIALQRPRTRDNESLARKLDRKPSSWVKEGLVNLGWMG